MYSVARKTFFDNPQKNMANWYYYNSSGEKIEVTGGQLKELAKQGVVTPETMVETEEGKAAPARRVKGLTFGEVIQPEAPETEIYGISQSETIAIASDVILPQSPQPTEAVAVPAPAPSAANPFCTNCGNSVIEQAVACMSCGARPTGHKKFCRRCGVGLNPEQIVCIKCGSAINAADVGGKSFGKFWESLSKSFSASNTSFPGASASSITIGDVAIFAAAALALISFFLPWIQGFIPLIGQIAKNGFADGAFWFGLIFIYPVWMAFAKKRTQPFQIGAYVCAGIGTLLGLVYTSPSGYGREQSRNRGTSQTSDEEKTCSASRNVRRAIRDSSRRR